MMCTSGLNYDGTCKGDSGGPLFDKDNDVVVGVVSWTQGGCFDGSNQYPGVYARVGTLVSKKYICIYTQTCICTDVCLRVPIIFSPFFYYYSLTGSK